MTNTDTMPALNTLDPGLDPGQRSPEKRRRLLLESAIAEFSTHGIGGARVDRIAQRANSNKAMVYHYFGSKEELYLAAMEHLYVGIRSAEEQLLLDPADPIGAMKALISFTFRYYIDNPAFVRMINTENLHGAVHLQAATGMEGLNSAIVNRVSTIIESGVAQGLFRQVDPLDLYISISALGFTYVSNRHTLKVLFGRELLAEDAIEARLQTMTDMILRFIAADGHQAAPATAR